MGKLEKILRKGLIIKVPDGRLGKICNEFDGQQYAIEFMDGRKFIYFEGFLELADPAEIMEWRRKYQEL